MTIPRFAGFLIALAVTPVAHALQLGQAAAHSYRGQPLEARVEVFGSLGGDAASPPEVEVLPIFGDASGGLDAAGVRAALRTDRNGVTYVALTSSAPLAATRLAFRLRVGATGESLVRNYTLAFAAPPSAPIAQAVRPRPRRAAARPAELVAPAAPVALPVSGNYGPVRSGETLWQILAERGLVRGDVAATMAEVVRANPAAFVNGDANRLRAGVLLNLPESEGAVVTAAHAPVSTATAVNEPEAAAPAAGDADTAARLARLAERFAQIRARYEAQQAAMQSPRSDVEASTAPLDAEVLPATAAPAGATRPAAPASAPTSAARDAEPPAAAVPAAQPRPSPAPAASGMPWTMLGTAGLLAIALVTFAARRVLTRGRQAATATAEIRSADQAKLAEIAQKTVKRIEMEDELRRTIGGRGRAAEAQRDLSRVASL